MIIARKYPKKKKPPNILMILADDLGFADTSVAPFTGNGIVTPELQKMASRGAVMTNFHSAAATCSPARASILTGLYPWRLGVRAVYEYGLKGRSNRDGWLPQLPTIAMALRGAGYMTGHSGKWHLGGMRNDDLDMRSLPLPLSTSSSSPSSGRNSSSALRPRKCQHPGPNQQGFDSYVSILDGPGSARQNELQVGQKLHSQGCRHLVKNDRLISSSIEPPETMNSSSSSGSETNEILSDCEARYAMQMMEDAVHEKRPFFIQLWFHAPHGPWEELPGFDHLYSDDKAVKRPKKKGQPHNLPKCKNSPKARFCLMPGDCKKGSTMMKVFDRGVSAHVKYRTMVSAMDRSIGRVLRMLQTLHIAENTLVVFTSDNGPEDSMGVGQTGSALPYRGTKRSLYEGGLRVPTIWQWVGTIPAGSSITTFGVSTDLFPTFLHAAGVAVPGNVYLDGESLLPHLIGKKGHEEGSNNDMLVVNGMRATALPYPLLYPPASRTGEVGDTTATSLSGEPLNDSRSREKNSGLVNKLQRGRGNGKGGKGNKRKYPQKQEQQISSSSRDRSLLLTNDLSATAHKGSSAGGYRYPQPAPFSTSSSSSSSSSSAVPAVNGSLGSSSSGDRIVMWHSDFEGPRSSALWIYDFKLLLDASDEPAELYDMRADPYETKNLLLQNYSSSGNSNYTTSSSYLYYTTEFPKSLSIEDRHRLSATITRGEGGGGLSSFEDRQDPLLHRWIVSRTSNMLFEFAKRGNAAHTIYLDQNPGRTYTPTVESSNRHHTFVNLYQEISKAQSAKMRGKLLRSTCSTPCSCDVPGNAEAVDAFPFELIKNARTRRINPGSVGSAYTALNAFPTNSESTQLHV